MQVLKKANGHEVNPHIGVSRGGKTTKIYTIVDGLGNPLAFLMTGGQVYDSVPATGLFQDIEIAESQRPPSLESRLASLQGAPLGRMFFQQTKIFSPCGHVL